MATSKYVCIQASHWNIKYNCDPNLRGGTGAPQESGTNVAVAMRLEQILQSKGYKTFLTDANYNCDKDSDKIDYDLFLSLHCDANYAGDEGGGFVDYPDPSVDSSNAESKRIKEAIESVYFKESGIRNVPSRSNANTKFYYMWSALSPKTPCVILEMGESIDPHDRVILNDTERVAQAIAKGIFKAFPDVATSHPQPPVDNCDGIKKELEALKKEHEKCNMLNLELSSVKAELLTITRNLDDAIASRNLYQRRAEDLSARIDKAKVALS